MGIPILAFRLDPAGEVALLGKCEVGRVNNDASWISFLPTGIAGIRMVGTKRALTVDAAKDALENSVKDWIAACRLVPRAAR